MPYKPRAIILLRSATLSTLFFATSHTALTQSIPLGCSPEPSRGVSLDQPKRSEDLRAPLLITPLKPRTLEEAYHPITPGQRMRWFLIGTLGPSHMAGVVIVSAGGTAVNRPPEYGTHWSGFADRFGISVAGSAVGNAMEASAGLLFHEDPRYFRASKGTFKSRVGSVIRQTFSARTANSSFAPAYARYLGIVGGNFLSNTWRVHSEANAQSALLRSSEGFAGRMATNAFAEFWPDVKKHVFDKRNRAVQLRLEHGD